ncbi:MAG: nucleoid-structuring protein H-NS [Desulfobacteraceae bacterium]|nr:nucleoid-structuring protein H-NS [Desulfobacteraceae bacterium]
MKKSKLKICDCTIRDGGLINDSCFSLETVRQVYKAAASAGIDIIELGYKNSRKLLGNDQYGPWRFCDDEILRKVVSGIETQMKIAVMQDAHKALARDLLPRENSVIDIVRVATYVRDLEKAVHLANTATDKGYTTFINIMAISHVRDDDLIRALEKIKSETRTAGCYIVDSFGSFHPRHIDHYMKLFREHLGDTDIGIHCHNQQQLAFSNTLRAAEKGALYLDATLYGMGRAAGNCPLELLVGSLDKPGMDIRPLLDVIGEHILPLKQTVEWGYTIPYMLTGLLNLHPKDGIRQMNLKEEHPAKYAFGSFFEHISDIRHMTDPQVCATECPTASFPESGQTNRHPEIPVCLT